MLFVGCSSSDTSKTNIYSINSAIILDGATETKLSDIAQSVDYIQLETRDDVLIAGHCVVYFADSLLIVRSGGEILIFDSATGKYKYKIIGHQDRGPIGYSESPLPMIINDDSHEIILRRWDKFGRWNYMTGQFINGISSPIFRYNPIFYVNDSMMAACLMNADLSKDKSSFNLISINDFSIVKEYGFFDEWDYRTNSGSTNISRAYRYKDTIGYCHYKNDTIFGLDKKTLSLNPRFVLNLGSKLTPTSINEQTDNPQYGQYIAVGSINESERYLFAEFVYDGWCYPMFFDKKSGKSMCIDKYQWEPGVTYGFINDISGFGKFYPLFTTPDAKRGYMVYQALEFIKMAGEERAAQMGIKENDNPIVMVATLK